MKKIIIIVIVIISYSIFSQNRTETDLDDKSVEELLSEEEKSEKIIEYEKKRFETLRKNRIKKQYNADYIHSLTIQAAPNTFQGMNGLAFQDAKKENPFLTYIPSQQYKEDLSSRNTSIFSSYYYLPLMFGVDFYLLSFSSNPSILSIDPIKSQISNIQDSKKKDDITFLMYQM